MKIWILTAKAGPDCHYDFPGCCGVWFQKRLAKRYLKNKQKWAKDLQIDVKYTLWSGAVSRAY